MAFSEEVQLELPDSFPDVAFTDFMAAARSMLLPEKGRPWNELAGASNLIAWRYRASSEDLDAYRSSWDLLGGACSFEELYLRERALFGMFVSGISCIDSSCYAIYALASSPKVFTLPFGLKEQRRSSPKTLYVAIKPFAQATLMAQTLDDLIKSEDWKLWNDLRNRMTHRSNLPRIIRGAGGSLPPPAKAVQFAETSSTPAIEADVTRLDALFSWLGTSLESLLEGGRSLVHGT